MLRRNKQKRQAILLIVLLAVVFAIIAIVQVAKDDDKAATTTTTTTAPKTAYVPRPFTGEVWQATIQTNFGTITTLLDPALAPKGVQAFVDLAQAGKFDGIPWARAAKDFVIQSAEPKDTTKSLGTGEPAPFNQYLTGDLGFAKSDTDPALDLTGTFFLVAGSDTALLNSRPDTYAWFGNVKDQQSLNVAVQIMNLAPPANDGPPTKTATIEKVTVKKVTVTATTTTTAADAGSTTTAAGTSTTTAAK